MSPCFDVSLPPCFRNSAKGKRNERKMATSVCLLQKNGNSKLPFVCCTRKRKTENFFPLLANEERWLTIAVSANMPIYGYVCLSLLLIFPQISSGIRNRKIWRRFRFRHIIWIRFRFRLQSRFRSCTCILTYMYEYVCVYMYLIYLRICIYLYSTWVYIIHAYMFIYIDEYIYVYAYVCIRKRIRIHTYT